MNHPYKKKPDYCFWSKSIAVQELDQKNFYFQPRFKLSHNLNIGTAGSCFAQNIAKYMQANNIPYYFSEKPHPNLDNILVNKYFYNQYSARYGNIYTVRQLKQLIYEAFGKFNPKKDYWKMKNGVITELKKG